MKNTYILIFALLITSLGFGQTTIYTQDFETLNSGYTASATEGTGDIDVFNRTNPDIGGNSSFIWAVEDTGVTPATLTLDQIDVTGYSEFTFSIDMLAHHFEDWDSTDELLITYSLDSGASQNLMWVQMVPDDTFNGPAALDIDFDGEGDCGASTTLPALTTGTQHGCTVSASTFATFTSAVIPLSGNTTLDIELAFNGLTSADEGIYLDNIVVEANGGGAPETSVQFATTSATVSEGVGTYDLVVEIANEDAAATNFDVVLTSGDAADIDSFTTQSETFPGSSSTNINVTITVTDDASFEDDEVFTFEIQNVTGGNNAAVGLNNTFNLTITNNDAPPTIALPYSEDFSDCGAAQWVTFDESGDQSWSCAAGQYTMNGFPNPDDIDWLISNFSIDFDATSNETIAVTTSEQFGDTFNDPGEFELRYSTDYDGLGDPTSATWTALTFDPNNTSTGFGASADAVTVVDASGITGTAYLAFYYNTAAGTGAEEWNVTDISIQEGAAPTSVEFTTTSASVSETDGTYDLEFAIFNEDATNDTTFDVVLIAGDAADIDSYSTQTVTFLAGTSANQTVTVTITDDIIEELDEVLTFEIQNVAGGNAAAVGANSTFDLTILANDAPAVAAGWQITAENTSFVIDFDTTVSGVNEGTFNASGFTTPAASGQLDSESWESTGMSDGDLSYGGSQTSGDYARGTSSGSVTSGGFYAFDTGAGNSTLGFQGTGGDFTPGTITLRAQNQTGNTVTAADLAYLIYVFNDQGRANTFNFSYSTDDVTYTDVAALNFTTEEIADGVPAWTSTSRSTSITGLSIADGAYLYLRWTSDDDFGGGSRDEIALDDIDLTFNPVVVSTTYTFNGTWAPSDPNGTATASDDIIIASGDAVIDTNTTCNSVTVNPGAGLTVDTGITLTSTNGVALESTSTTYSSLILNGSITGVLTYERHVNINGTGSTGSNDLISAPLTGQAFNVFEDANPNILSDNEGAPTQHLFGPFDKTTGAYVIYSDSETATLDAGVGYRAASNDNGTFTFTGTAENGLIPVTIENSGPDFQEWNLVGNPYPSYLNVQDFLNYVGTEGVPNIALFNAGTEAIYGYDGDATNGWSIINLASTTPSTVMAPGQGFFVSASATASLEFHPDMRSTGTSDDYIAGRTAELTYLTLNLNTDSKSDRTKFYFNAEASEGFDRGYDAKVWGTVDPSFGIYSHLVQNNEGDAFALQTLNPSNLNEVSIPLGVNAGVGEQITFAINESTLPESVKVYLEDTVMNTTVLLNTSDYVITPATDLSGTGRFFLRISEDALTTTENGLELLNIYALNSTNELVISGQLDTNNTIQLFDVQGRQVLSAQLDSTKLENRMDVSSLNAGIYVATIENNGQLKSQKVILK